MNIQVELILKTDVDEGKYNLTLFPLTPNNYFV